MAATPFLLRFAKALPEIPFRSLRYDKTRQVLQVFVAGAWVGTLGTPDNSRGLALLKTDVEENY